MPYLRFTTTSNEQIQLSGNSVADFTKAIEKHGSIKETTYAMAWVKAYFARRDLDVIMQKAKRGEVKVNEEEMYAKLDDAADEEDKFKDAYEAVCKGKKTKVTVAADASKNASTEEDNSEFYNQATTINEVSEDMF